MATRKLTTQDVRMIRELYSERRRLLAEANKLSMERIAEKFDVAHSTIRDIIYYKTYKEIKP